MPRRDDPSSMKRLGVLIAVLAAVALAFGTAARPEAAASAPSFSVSSPLSPPQ